MVDWVYKVYKLRMRIRRATILLKSASTNNEINVRNISSAGALILFQPADMNQRPARYRKARRLGKKK